MRSDRRKRASAEDLYKSCRQGGDCIPDVVQKFEHKTVADSILKWGSTAIYLGGLGIGTGSSRPTASPGWTIPTEVPYRSLPGGANRPSGGWQIPRQGTFQLPRPLGPVLSRPTAVENIVPTEFTVSSSGDVTIGDVGPGAPSVIVPETVPNHTDTVGLSIVTEHPDSVHVSIDVGNGDNPAVLEIPPEESSDRINTVTTRSGTSRHTFQLEAGGSIVGETSETPHIFVNGTNIGGDTAESIEMQTFSGPRTSTPDSSVTGRLRGVNNPFSRRYYTQVTVTDPAFLENPRAYVTDNVFENPAFEEDPDDSIAFPDVSSRPVPKNTDVLDIGRLGRLQFTRSPGGGLGASRIGTRFSLRTRSGVDIGAQVHFRHPIEPILEEIELADLAPDTNNDLNEGGLLSDTSFADIPDAASTHTLLADNGSEAALLDSQESLSLGHLSFSTFHTVDTIPVGDSLAETSDLTVTDIDNTLITTTPQKTDLPSDPVYTEESKKKSPPSRKRTYTPLVLLQPAVYVDTDYEPYYFYLHPHLLGVKKKKKTSWFFSDGVVDTRA